MLTPFHFLTHELFKKGKTLLTSKLKADNKIHPSALLPLPPPPAKIKKLFCLRGV